MLWNVGSIYGGYQTGHWLFITIRRSRRDQVRDPSARQNYRVSEPEGRCEATNETAGGLIFIACGKWLSGNANAGM